MRMKARVNLSLESDTLNRSKEIGINLSQFLQYSLDHALNNLTPNHESLGRDLNPRHLAYKATER